MFVVSWLLVFVEIVIMRLRDTKICMHKALVYLYSCCAISAFHAYLFLTYQQISLFSMQTLSFLPGFWFSKSLSCDLKLPKLAYMKLLFFSFVFEISDLAAFELQLHQIEF